jgi:hypothetical protein
MVKASTNIITEQIVVIVKTLIPQKMGIQTRILLNTWREVCLHTNTDNNTWVTLIPVMTKTNFQHGN